MAAEEIDGCYGFWHFCAEKIFFVENVAEEDSEADERCPRHEREVVEGVVFVPTIDTGGVPKIFKGIHRCMEKAAEIYGWGY